ncbi:hypothetical protein [Clostridium thermosuccinogenes]|uniref:hypothetical protein n=1 Tax=Clostridium thermosuccinogenes TaxID=84032 RepID=UPI000CCBE3CA|nr:hypothetical protein [Pseudoclostridium thermosuccinogenes]PNT94135.1 hypothetical protein CDQ83_11850 [Pseudoclostridium thermosuccinogenes]
MKSCEIIAYHQENGKTIPLKMRIYEDNKPIVLTIKSFVELTETQQKNIKRYRCKIIVNDAIRECDLIFYKDMTKWVLTNIK